MTSLELDPLLHQPIRTRLTAYLAARGETTFTELRQVLEVTDGNLDGHIKKLLAAGYLRARKQRGKGRPQTLYLLSETGLQAFQTYIQILQALLPEQANERESEEVAPADESGPSPQTT
ncbi:MAG: transcriptional regulator [Pseudomonadota bacterium]